MEILLHTFFASTGRRRRRSHKHFERTIQMLPCRCRNPGYQTIDRKFFGHLSLGSFPFFSNNGAQEEDDKTVSSLFDMCGSAFLGIVGLVDMVHAAVKTSHGEIARFSNRFHHFSKITSSPFHKSRHRTTISKRDRNAPLLHNHGRT